MQWLNVMYFFISKDLNTFGEIKIQLKHTKKIRFTKMFNPASESIPY